MRVKLGNTQKVGCLSSACEGKHYLSTTIMTVSLSPLFPLFSSFEGSQHSVPGIPSRLSVSRPWCLWPSSPVLSQWAAAPRLPVRLHRVPHPRFQTLSLALAIDLLAAHLDPVILQELSCCLFASLSFYLLSSPQRYVSDFELLRLGLCNVLIACCI